MKHLVYTVHDRKTGAFLRPFFMPTTASAERAFADLCNDESHEFGKHPEDYTLFKSGEFDDKTGVISSMVSPVSIGVGITYLYVDDNGQIDLLEDAVNG